MGISSASLRNPLAPLLHSARHYSVGKFRRDVVAGLTVSVVELPQAMAYALIAGVPPQYGIYSSIIQGVLGALFSSSDHLTTGPTNTQSLLIASAISATAVDPAGRPETYLQLVFLLSLLKGIIQLSFWGFHVGELVQFVSRAVIVGVSAGAGVLIIVGQIAPMLGLQLSGPATLPGILGAFERLIPRLGETNWHAVSITLAVVAIAWGARRINRFIPGPLVAVVAATLLVMLMGWQTKVPILHDLPDTLPQFTLPTPAGPGWDAVSLLLPGALALALLGGIESVAIAKTIAARSGERVEASQEFFAQGLTNAISSFFQCIPGSGSFTRSMLDFEAGAATRFAAVMNALFVGTLFFLLADYAKNLPMAALAGVLLVIAAGLIDVQFFRRVWRADRSDAIVFLVTFLAVLFTRLDYAIFIGIFVNIAFYLRTSSRLHIAEMVQTETGAFVERSIYDRTGERRVVFLQLEGELFFAIADQLQDQLTATRRSGVRVVILRLKRCHSIDGTVLDVLERFALDMRRHNGWLMLCGVRPEVMRTIEGYGLTQVVGRENIFPAERGVFVGAKKALDRARTLLGASIDMSELQEEEEFAYDI